MNRETVWISNVDKDNIHSHKIKNLNNKHLANIIYHISNGKGGHSQEHSDEIIDVLVDEAFRRGLSINFLLSAPFEYDKTKPYEEYHESNSTEIGSVIQP